MAGADTSTNESTDGGVDIRTIHQLTGFQRDLLYCIAGLERPSGQTIREELEEQTDSEITHGRLYPNLDTLVNTGLAEKGDIDRRTNYYAISSEGVEALREYHEWGGDRLP
jgi:DNA-binding PadR family transcriptional regulator